MGISLHEDQGGDANIARQATTEARVPYSSSNRKRKAIRRVRVSNRKLIDDKCMICEMFNYTKNIST